MHDRIFESNGGARVMSGSASTISRDNNSSFPSAFDILVVDDNAVELNAAKVLLQNAGYRVCVAANGQAATHALRHHAVRLVLADLLLSDHDGLELLLAINNTGKDIPLVGLSTGEASVSAELMAHLVRHFGARQVVAKPLSPLEVLVAIRDVIGAPATATR